MKKVMRVVMKGIAIFLSLNLLAISFCNQVFAQEDSTAKQSTERRLNNVLKYNLSAGLLYDNSLQFAFERVMKNRKHSLNIFGGPLKFPIDINIPSLALDATKSRSGYTLGADYRFYLQKENKYDAPRGIYVAPFVAYYNFDGTKSAIYTDSSGTKSNIDLNTKISFFNVGGQLGYQFVIKKHFVVDFVMFGPALTSYKFKASIDGNIPAVDKESLLGQIITELKDRYPLLNELSEEQEVNRDGIEAFWSLGFRYNFSIGYRF